MVSVLEDNMQRNLIIGAGVIVILGFGVMSYFYFFDNGADIVVAPRGTVGEGFPVVGDDGQFPVTEETGVVTTDQLNQPAGAPPQLAKISDGPVVHGMAVINRTTAVDQPPETVVSYIERQSGNVYSYVVNTGTRTRTSNRTVPGIQVAHWLPDASYAFVRYLSGTDYSTINTYALPSNGSGGFFLQQNLSEIAVSSAKILTLASGVNGSVSSLLNIDGSGSTELFTTPLSSLRIGFAGRDRYLAFTKPSGTLSGSAFIVDRTGRFARVAGPLNGLVAVTSPLGNWLLVSYVHNNAMQMILVSTETGESLPLPVATIADKCVWAADDSVVYCGVPVNPPAEFNYPDDWYQGAVYFSDRIWKIDVSERFAQLVLDPTEEAGGPIDVTAPAIDPLSTTLVFVNKRDGSLWAYSF